MFCFCPKTFVNILRRKRLSNAEDTQEKSKDRANKKNNGENRKKRGIRKKRSFRVKQW